MSFTNARLLQIRALLVDDNAMNLSILKAYCKKRRYDYDSASDGIQAFQKYTAACEAGSPPTICLLDLQMPICDGIGCARMIRAYEKQRKYERCPIVMGECLRPTNSYYFVRDGLNGLVLLVLAVTAQGGDADRKEAIEAGTDAYYVKPLRVSTLDDIVSRYART